MSHFNVKSLSFYAVAIGSVVVLFKFVSAYGETNLKAPNPIDGRYRLATKNLPGCLKNNDLLLDIQQSGIYLNGSLLPGVKSGKSQELVAEKPSLTGKFNSNNFAISGAVPHLTSCPNQTIDIQGLVKGKTIQGKMTLSSIPQAVTFTAKKEESAQLEKKQGSH